MSWIAELDTHGREFPTCVHVTKVTNTMTHGATYVPIEDGKAVRDENAKLREMCTALYRCRDKISKCATCEDVACPFADDCMLHARMRELGIEVTA